MPKQRGVSGFWLDIDGLEESRTTLIAELGWQKGMMAYASHVRLFTWQYSAAKPIKDGAHVARILGCDPRAARNLWAYLGAILPRTYIARYGGSYCKRTGIVLDNYNKKQGIAGTTGDPKNPGDSYSYSDPKSRDLKTDLLSTAPKKTSAVNREDLPDCPHQKIIDLYHDHTPCRRVRTWNGQRPGLLRTLWREHPELDWWRGLFQYVSESDFLCGRCKPNGDRTTFMADLEWMLRPNNFQKINEGKYHRDIRQTDTRGNGTTDAREATTRRLRAVPESGR